MKNKLKLINIILILAVLLSSCSIYTQKKPNSSYYTELLKKALSSGQYSGYILDTNFYRQESISPDEILTIKNFLNDVKKNNFVKKSPIFNNKPEFRMYLTFSKEKYIINIYNERYISIFPWDGDFNMDYIDMKGINTSVNLYNLSKFIIPRY